MPPRSTLWALRDEIAVVMPGVCVERPRLSDERLMRAACAGLHADRPHADRPATPQETGPVRVATDGSVRGKVTGYGWLASPGEYGLMGFRHSKKQIGPKVVLVAELRAITKAVQKFRGREITMLSDSKLAIAMVKRWMAGEFVLPEGYTGIARMARRRARNGAADDLHGARQHQPAVGEGTPGRFPQ